MMDRCRKESGSGFKCDSCAFSEDGLSTCANPNIWNEPQTDSYFKSRGSELTKDEAKSIKLRLN